VDTASLRPEIAQKVYKKKLTAFLVLFISAVSTDANTRVLPSSDNFTIGQLWYYQRFFVFSSNFEPSIQWEHLRKLGSKFNDC
jgi:hypothetical protein